MRQERRVREMTKKIRVLSQLPGEEDAQRKWPRVKGHQNVRRVRR